MKDQYKVVKEFGFAKVGDIFERVASALNEETSENNFVYELNNARTSEVGNHQIYSYGQIVLNEDTVKYMVEDGYLAEVTCEESPCKTKQKVNTVIDFIDEMLIKYENTANNIEEAFEENKIPECVKVEGTTVYFNLIKVLSEIKTMLLD